MADETDALRAEVAELRAEVERLQAWQAAHVCQPAPGTWPAQCTCGTSARCPVHAPPHWQGTSTTTIRPWASTCAAAGAAAGAAAAPIHTYFVNTAAAQSPFTVAPLHYNTMGAAPQPQIFSYEVGGECA